MDARALTWTLDVLDEDHENGAVRSRNTWSFRFNGRGTTSGYAGLHF